MIRAPLRWAGSKRKSLPALRLRSPASISRYIEPFAGSACFVFQLTPDEIVLGDLNERLVEFYNHLTADPKSLHAAYSAHEANQTSYYEVRKLYNALPASLDRAAKFLYLNRLCFNGIYRVNKAGSFNVPWGGDKVGRPLSLEDLVNAANHLGNATITCSDFETTVDENLTKDSFVYLDPPYARDEARVFREYHENSFATSDWTRLERLLDRINAQGAKFLLSYAGDDALVERLKCWNIGYIDVTRNVGGFKASRRKHREFMASNYAFSA